MPEQLSPTTVEASGRAAELTRMLEEAKRQPGVADVAAVYENWRQIDAIRQAVAAATTTVPVVQAFDSSAPAY